MRRASVTLTDDLEAARDAYLADQPAKPSLTAVMQAALGEFLRFSGYMLTMSEALEGDDEELRAVLAKHGYRVCIPPKRHLTFPITPRPSGTPTASMEHDRVLAGEQA